MNAEAREKAYMQKIRVFVWACDARLFLAASNATSVESPSIQGFHATEVLR